MILGDAERLARFISTGKRSAFGLEAYKLIEEARPRLFPQQDDPARSTLHLKNSPRIFK
ncbi:MAG TPA: hypothetical protein VHV47_09635 [Opitutaceae bacterium]|nr:hypothetical protein [Opitutaceae bacterium]